MDRERRAEQERVRKEERPCIEKGERPRNHEPSEWTVIWSEMARKMGTVVGDIVAPSISGVVADIFGLPDEDPLHSSAIHERRTRDGRRVTFDAVVAWPGYFLINETRDTLSPRDVRSFIKKIRRARWLFPEYKDRKLVGALASLDLDSSLVRFVEHEGFIIMGLGDHLMEAKNSPGFCPKEF
jgi:hypothetical protein